MKIASIHKVNWLYEYVRHYDGYIINTIIHSHATGQIFADKMTAPQARAYEYTLISEIFCE